MIGDIQQLTPRHFRNVQRLIYELAGIALQDNKESMVQGRLSKRLRTLSLTSYDEYLSLLEKDLGGPESIEFINCLTTNKTDFFRENHHFQFLADELLPALKPALEAGETNLRIWSAACSTGEEPYSIAMTLRQALSNAVDMRILASDIDTKVLEHCAQGVFTTDRVADIPKPLLHGFFVKEREMQGTERVLKWRASQTLRDMISFRRINFQDDKWPINSSFDVIFCRNVMIYFDVDTQRRLVERFAEYLKPQGYLILGHAESLSTISDQFDSLGKTIHRLKVDAKQPARRSSPGRPTARHGASDHLQVAPVPRSTATQLRSPSRSRSQTSIGTQSDPIPDIAPRRFVKGEPVSPIIVGEMHASCESTWISTVLGSCVAACLFDAEKRIGGMNHFMLPRSVDSTMCASYGVHAMEMLINDLMKMGADRRRLRAKLFGGGAVIRTSSDQWNIGQRNVEFALQFLEAEQIPLTAKLIGGKQAMHVHFHTRTHKALVRLLDNREAIAAVAAEDCQLKSQATVQSSVTLF